jgi:hypothetical protein
MPPIAKLPQPGIPPDPQRAEMSAVLPHQDAGSNVASHVPPAATRRIGQARGEFAVPDDIDGQNATIAEMFSEIHK